MENRSAINQLKLYLNISVCSEYLKQIKREEYILWKRVHDSSCGVIGERKRASTDRIVTGNDSHPALWLAQHTNYLASDIKGSRASFIHFGVESLELSASLE